MVHYEVICIELTGALCSFCLLAVCGTCHRINCMDWKRYFMCLCPRNKSRGSLNNRSYFFSGILLVTSIVEALRALWCAAYPGVELLGLISEQWKDMGWQGKDPSTDFRGGGFISVENMFFFARNYPVSYTFTAN
ncbi:hypothetical protein ZIOFF_024472 [Zingiber officinale]|uniref:ELMO domain-containing protein n=1 Tax=Zingiber officinale TaxID=94328 RepID=A0A8J5GSG4_ZINOF|nr:hypothetical protein ZIOFF_024472 [Zingiber officinale]